MTEPTSLPTEGNWDESDEQRAERAERRAIARRADEHDQFVGLKLRIADLHGENAELRSQNAELVIEVKTARATLMSLRDALETAAKLIASRLVDDQQRGEERV